MGPFDSSGNDGASFRSSQEEQGVAYPQNLNGRLQQRDASTSQTSLNAPGLLGTANTSSASLVDPLLLRRSAKAVPPIQIPPSSTASLALRSPAMRSSALTDSFPLPPPRTPLTPSTSQGSHVAVADSPRVHLSVPPPSPYASKRSSGQSGYWDADLSSLRDQAGHPGIASTGQSSPVGTPGATQAYIAQPQRSDRVQSYIAEVSSMPPHSPSGNSVTYPPTTYSPNPAQRRSSNAILGSPIPIQRDAASLPGSPAAEPQEYFARRDSAGTFASALSSMHSMGMSGAINTLEHEGFDFQSDRSPSLSSHAHAFSDVASITSSIGKTHHLVRHGNVLEARRPNELSMESSRRLARASLVSSQLLRSASSTDALKDMLRSSPAATPDPDKGFFRPPVRPHLSQRYSSGPAPSLASLAEDLPYDTVDGDEGVFVSPKRISTRPKNTSRHSSGWTSRSPHSRKSRQSRDTHFTIASDVPSMPSIGNHAKRAELAMRDSRMSTRKMAKRASRLSQILADRPSQGRYVSSFPSNTGEETRHTSLDELRFGANGNGKKQGAAIPGIWASNYSGIVGAGSTDSFSTIDHPGTYSDSSIDESHFRRRRSYPVNDLPVPRRGPGTSPLAEKKERSSFSSGGSAPRSKKTFLASMTSSKKRRLLLLLLLLIVLIVVLGIVGGLLLRKKLSSGASDGCYRSCLNGGTVVMDGNSCTCRCSGAFVGTFCQLDATCQCPHDASQCDVMLAKSVASAASYSNTLFTPPINTTRLATSLQAYSQAGTDCTKQAQLLDLPNLDAGRYRSRQKWTQAVVLWDMASSEDFDNTSLRDFQSRLDYWRWQDKASFDAQSTFQALSHGYTIDFAFQKIFAPQKSLADAGIATAQIGRLDDNSTAAFQRVLAYASAGSVQRSTAVDHLFSELGYTSEQLAIFTSNVKAAQVFFPFDATGQMGGRNTLEVAVQAQANGQTFPRPLSCVESFSGATLDAVNRVENGIFGLAPVVADAPANCSEAVRPVYGFLNILNLRAPISGGSVSAGQAVAVTNADIKGRMSFRAGPSLGSLPADPASVNVTRITTDTFGTFDQLDAVLLNYLNQLSALDLAKPLIDYVLQTPETPPESSSALLASLVALPPIEVQLWGRLSFSEIDYVVSDIAVEGREPIFGRPAGSALRSWAHAASGSKPIRWASAAESAGFIVDNAGDGRFQQIWDSSAASSEQDILNTLQGAGLVTQT